jgi:hypothetical protein
VFRAGGGFAAFGDLGVSCADGESCDEIFVEGPGVLLAGGVESTRGWATATRAELELFSIPGSENWALAGGPLLSARLAFLEFGGGLLLFRARGDEVSRSGWAAVLLLGLAAPVKRWTIHAGIDWVSGDRNVFGALLGGSISRRF